MVSTWDPDLYLRFTDQRLRPALDLMARVPLAEARAIYDLGCGTGSVTRLLRERWPRARVTGVDASPEMLDRAKAIPDIRWEHADLANWRADSAADLVYSNATFHWLDHHEALFPHLFGQVSSGGFLAVQMPRQHLKPSHTILFELVREGRWNFLADAIREDPVHEPGFYYDTLCARAAALDVWETEYLHVLEGEAPVLAWFAGSILRPVLDRLDSSGKAAFLGAYGQRLREAYPARADGRTLLPFLRLFIVAQKR
ncbi:MAG TPA: methyltransferase domain-containing protein [Burkholderiales bacterium]|nr:methyltransferase domain-containing protein [Burkholderiales bacterium]